VNKTEIFTPEQIKKEVKKTPEIESIKRKLKEHGYEFETEYKFHIIRKWRFDLALPKYKVAIEYEGIMSKKSRHTTIKGFTTDCEKYNEAAIWGWKVLRYTTLNYKDMIKDLNAIMIRFTN
jgi:hypothetical protein